METIINLFLLCILIICAWSGYKKGLIMGVGGILAIIVSLYGANLLASTFSYDLIPVMRPFANGYMESRLDADDGVMEKMGWSDTGYSLDDLLDKNPDSAEKFFSVCYRDLGIDGDVSDAMAGAAQDYMEETDADAMRSVVQVLCEKVSYVGCFLLAFLLIIIILTVIGNLPNLSFKIPNMDIFNDICGILLGVATGAAFCMIAVWFLRFAGIIIGRDTLSNGILSSFFMEKNLLVQYLGF